MGFNESSTDLLQSLIEIGMEIQQTKDFVHSDKLKQLADKLEAGQLHIAFCGHFSAGKSSLINKLCGHDLLPSGPIPTSANIVSIRNGSPSALVTQRMDSNDATKHIIPLDQLSSYCMNGTDILTVEIQYPIAALQEHAVLLDTPGIDSADDAHYAATSSALHLADAVFYVMDYNHVQSEMNFTFTKQLSDWDKPLYLIVNQIDKHRESELSFAQYRQDVKDAFENWGITPQEIFYISLKESRYPHNEWNRLHNYLSKLIAQSDRIRRNSVIKSAQFLIEGHRIWLAEQIRIKQEIMFAGLEIADSAEAMKRQLELFDTQLLQIEDHPAQILIQLKEEMNRTIDNANLVPAQTRELAHAYLQSTKPGFKVGLLFSSVKTSVEKENRINAFYNDLMDKVKVNLDWHLKDLFRKAYLAEGVDINETTEEVNKLLMDIPLRALSEQIQAGAVVSNEYTMNYCKQLAADVKAGYRKSALEMLDRLMHKINAAAQDKAEVLKASIKTLSGHLDSRIKADELEFKAHLHIKGLIDCLPPLTETTLDIMEIEEAALVHLNVDQDQDQALFQGTNQFISDFQSAYSSDQQQGTMDGNLRGGMESTARNLLTATDLIKDIPVLSSLMREMKRKADRLFNNSFTIALFGAFSAGKSSFANALMGSRALPVSPNPTTAAIIHIEAPKEPQKHGTALVKLKTKSIVEADLKHSLEQLGYRCSSIENGLEVIRMIKPESVNSNGKPHFAFLKALEQGWFEMEQTFGYAMEGETSQELEVDLEQFRAFAAEESKSCFVDSIRLYYSCPITDLGIKLVDTPGADSINARHTGIAFNYIKNADAILFVTYYNHAFSQADREFLLQLGRVKESFEMDKMFFVVNAADLADSVAELNGVVGHLEANLLEFGIRHPRIYPVSSLMALEGKLREDHLEVAASGIDRFEADFMNFTFNELAAISIRSANHAINRTLDTLIQWIAGAAADEADKTRRIAELREAHARVEKLSVNISSAAEDSLIAQEITELTHYIKQRIGFRFGELFNAAFNPSSLSDDGKDLRKALAMAWQDLNRYISFELSQELLATSLRIENYLNRTANSWYSTLISSVLLELPDYVPDPFEASFYETPQLTDAMEAERPEDKWMWSYFKNPKHFFEKDGKALLRKELEIILQRDIARYVDKQAAKLNKEYIDRFHSHLQMMVKQVEISCRDYCDGMIAALSSDVDLPDLFEKRERLKSLLPAG